MNFLTLCQRTREKAGIAGSGPLTTVSQIGESGRVVNYVREAYEELQNKHLWSFLRRSFEFNTTVAEGHYLKSIVANTSSWKTNSFRCYKNVADEQFIDFLEWDEFRDLYLRGLQRTQPGRPIKFTVEPDFSLRFWPIPDDVYVINGEQYRMNHEFASDTDVPLFDKFHWLIIYSALEKYAQHVGDPAVYSGSERDHRKLARAFEFEYLPKITV